MDVFRETKETETYIEWMFHHVKEKMKKRITPENKTDPGKFVVPFLIGGLTTLVHFVLTDRTF